MKEIYQMIKPGILRPTILAGLLVVLPAAIQAVGGEMAIETWGAGAKVSHPRTLTIRRLRQGSPVLSALLLISMS